MRLFGRKQPLHQALAEAGGLSLGDGAPRPGLSAAPPGWDGEQQGEPGIHGVPRARRWDAVVAVDAPELDGDTVHFVALGDGSLVVDEEQPDNALTPLADALETRLAPPYRAEAVRRDGSLWGVGGRRILLVREPALHGEEAELVVNAAGRTLTVDGSPRVAHVPALESAGADEAREFVVLATRVDEELWEVEVTPL